MSEDEERDLRDKFCKEHLEEFFEFVKDFDSTILWDFLESLRWKWNQYKEDNREHF
jgi:hypothetical protein